MCVSNVNVHLRVCIYRTTIKDEMTIRTMYHHFTWIQNLRDRRKVTYNKWNGNESCIFSFISFHFEWYILFRLIYFVFIDINWSLQKILWKHRFIFIAFNMVLLDLYTFRFGQKKLVRSEPSRRMKKTQSWVILWISLSSRSWLADTHFIILLKTRFLNLSSVFNFSFYESSKLKTLIFCNTNYKSKLQSFQ